MSAAAMSAGRLLSAPPVRAVTPALARLEARNLMRHPLTLFGFAVYLVNAVLTLVHDYGPRSAFETSTLILTFYPGLMMVLAANLVATRDRRADSDEVLDALPGRAEERVLALMLASLAPAVVGAVTVVGLHVGNLLLGRYAVTPGFWEIAAGPVTIVGACLFGTMLGVWFPARTVGLVGLVALVAVNVYVDGLGDARLFGMAHSWPRWGLWAEQWAGVYPGSPALHVGYLVGLCGLAVAASWVRVAHRRTPAVVVGVAAVVLTVAAGLGQLP